MTPTPRALLRLQFDKGFTLEAAIPLVDYFAELGVSHVCASPLLRSRPGPRHGFNVVDHSLIDPDVGGESALRRLSGALHRRQMGLILEIAPGHMGVGGTDNAAWLDLLEWGRDSIHAPWFDVDWRSPTPQLRGKILVPFLDRPYWEALSSGALSFAFDEATGSFEARHNEHAFPICPAHYASVLDAAEAPALEGMRAAFRGITTLRPDTEALRKAKLRLSTLAASDEGRPAMRAVLAAFDPDEDLGRKRLHALLERQNYRLAWWRTANDDLNWRRYLDVWGLAGLKVERTDVFEAIHEYVLKLYADSVVDGLRIAHLDLMADPLAYVRRLDLKLSGLSSRRAGDVPDIGCIGIPLPLLSRSGIAGRVDTTAEEDMEDERAPAPEALMDAIGQVLHEPTAAPALSETWSALSGEFEPFGDISIAARRDVLFERFGTELETATRAFFDVAQASPEGRDVTFAALRRVVREVCVFFPGRRAYGDMDGLSPEDEAAYAAAFALARAHIEPIDLPVADLLEDWLTRAPRTLSDFEQSGMRAQAIARFQQLTASLAARAQDSRALARYARLLSRNEVGSHPESLGLRPAAFHLLMEERRRTCPRALSATAGPDTRRGEDARVRLAAITEAPKEWDMLLRQLMELMAGFRSPTADGASPLPADEILLYQGIIAAWPLTLRLDDPLAVSGLKDRVTRWFLDAVRQSGRGTGWFFGDEAYERGCARFVEALFSEPSAQGAREHLARFVERLSLASVVNGYAQLTLKLTVPGIPDIYQGTDFWDFSLGNPDNRRAVDFNARAASLEAALSPDMLLQTWPDGRAKQALLARLLRLRAAEPALFDHGTYEALTIEGMREESALAFLRRHNGKVMIVAVTRLAMHLLGPGPMPPRVPTVRWGDTGFVLPDGMTGPFRNVISPREVEPSMGRLEIGELFSSFPVAVLVKG